MISTELLERDDVALAAPSRLLATALGVEAALTRPRTRDDWLDVVSDTQAMVDVLTAIQDHAIAEAARRETVRAEDGTLDEVVHATGRVSLDAADLLAPRIGAGHAGAQRRVESAVRLGADRTPVPAEEQTSPQRAGLHHLQQVRLEGRLDAARANLVADELQEAPAEVVEAVVAALDPHLGEDPAALRRRCRRLLARIAPDLLRDRAARARASTGLRRWVSEPGVDAWYGTFPSEAAVTAWAAIDAHARALVADGTCTTLEQARGQALTDLVSGSATVDVRLVLGVPAPAGDDGSTPSATHPAPGARTAPPGTGDARRAVADDLVEVHGARPSEPLLVDGRWLRRHLDERAVLRAPCHAVTGSRIDLDGVLTTTSYRPGVALAQLVRARDGRCRFPGCTVPARSCDLDHVRPWPLGPTAASNLVCLCRRHHRIKQRPGWWLVLDADGTATWTDPTGGTRTTAPVDALSGLVLHGHGASPPTSPCGSPSTPCRCSVATATPGTAPWSG